MTEVRLTLKEYLDNQSRMYYWLSDHKVPHEIFVVYSLENTEDATAFKLKFQGKKNDRV